MELLPKINNSKKILEIAVNSSVIAYNDALLCLSGILEQLNIEPGSWFIRNYSVKNKNRLRNMHCKSIGPVKKQRKALWSIRKGFTDKEKEEEGEAYHSGAF